MADQARGTPSQAPELTYELEWEPRVQQPKRRSRLSRLFPIGDGGGAAPEADPEAVAPAPAPPPPPPRRPSSFQRKTLPSATPPAAIPTPAARSTSDDDVAQQQASLAKEARQQQQQYPPVGRGDETPATFGQAEEEPPIGSDKFPAGLGATRSSRRRARLDAATPPDRKYLGMRRRVFLIVAAAILLLLLLALIIGLAVGLSVRKKNSDDDNLPLPGRDGGRMHEGELTFYDPGLGACGGSHGGGDLIAAVARKVFDAAANTGDGNPNNNPICGRKIRVERGDGSVDVTVVDRCEGCKSFDLDLSPSAFQRLAREEDGRVAGQWRWL